MKKILIVALVAFLFTFSGNVVEANEVEVEMELHEPQFSLGLGYIAIPGKSGTLMEGTIAFTPEFHVFAGLVPGDSGIKIASVGTDYRFSIENESLKPGLGAIFVGGEGFSPTASLTLQDPEEDQISFTIRGGYNVVSGSVAINF